MARELGAVAVPTLRLLRAQLGHDLWMVTRLVGDDLVVIESYDARYGVHPGAVLPWAPSVDWRMANGDGPRIAPRLADVPAYATAPGAAGIGSYAGVPLCRDGEVLGTLTGWHPVPLADSILEYTPTLNVLGELLATVLALEIRANDVTRRAERYEIEAHVDPLTQLGNRLAWTKAMVEEEARCRRYGHTACVISVDLDGMKRANDLGGHDAGDRLLRTAAVVLRRVSRMCDQVARVGGDEFALLAVEASEIEGHALADRLHRAFVSAGVEASIGVAARDGSVTMEEAWKAADAAMYRHKRRRLQERVTAALSQPEAPPQVVRQLVPEVAALEGTG